MWIVFIFSVDIGCIGNYICNLVNLNLMNIKNKTVTYRHVIMDWVKTKLGASMLAETPQNGVFINYLSRSGSNLQNENPTKLFLWQAVFGFRQNVIIQNMAYYRHPVQQQTTFTVKQILAFNLRRSQNMQQLTVKTSWCLIAGIQK